MKKEEFKLQKELIELQHKYKLEEIKFEKKCKEEIENLKHNHTLEAQRIKTAEIRRSMERKADMNYMRDYPK